jgi:hypothetical protein
VKLRTRDRLHGRRVTLGTSAFQSPGTQRRPVRVLVTAPVAAELRAAGSVRVYAFITGRDARGAATTIRAQLRVRGR